MNVVWPAVGELTSHEVAIKLILKSTADLRARLPRRVRGSLSPLVSREALVRASRRHPRVCDVLTDTAPTAPYLNHRRPGVTPRHSACIPARMSRLPVCRGAIHSSKPARADRPATAAFQAYCFDDHYN